MILHLFKVGLGVTNIKGKSATHDKPNDIENKFNQKTIKVNIFMFISSFYQLIKMLAPIPKGGLEVGHEEGGKRKNIQSGNGNTAYEKLEQEMAQHIVLEIKSQIIISKEH